MKDVFWNLLSKIGWHASKTQREALFRARQDLESLHLLPELSLEYIPWTEAELRPAGVRVLLNEVVVHSRCSVLEFGSGISTLYLANHFNRAGKGRVISVEEDEKWASVVESYLNELGVSRDRAQILRA
jgi:predicted O-methyltransferase YrrM